MLPYAMADKRFIRKLREPEGVKNSCWQRWHRPRQVARQQLGEAAKRLGRGFGLWEGALYEIGGLFGTGIQSYFTFLRFLLLLNLLTMLLTACFVLLPLLWLRSPEPGPALKLTGLQCSSSPLPQSDIPRFHNPLWNVLTGRVSGVSSGNALGHLGDHSLKGPLLPRERFWLLRETLPQASQARSRDIGMCPHDL